MRNVSWLTMCSTLLAMPFGPAVAQGVAKVLAPTGTLRIAVYAGSPTSLVKDASSGSARGVTVELGIELARRLAIPYELVVHQRPAEVLQTLSAGNADITMTNATAERGKIVDFGPSVLALELGFLVRDAQRLDLADLEMPDVAIGVSKGSTSEKTLPQRLPRARVVAAANLDQAGQMLLRGEIAAFATNKAILFDLADRTPGTRVLADRWGTEHLALAIPKGREAAKAYLEAFSRDVASTLVHDAAVRAGLRGRATD